MQAVRHTQGKKGQAVIKTSTDASSELSNKLSIIQDVKNGHEKLNLAFVANLFNTHPHLDPPAEDLDIIEETREEKVRG